jgi:4-diphosphocytidyl-2-C-methyl-D-erythritol kinase
VKARSYAKVNLWLRVMRKRADGFHEIETVFHSISLHDDLYIERSEQGTEVLMQPAIPDNLAERAARALLGDRTFGARVAIDKNIPLGAGLAGGSGNAAAVLRTLPIVCDLEVSADEAFGIAAGLGSDVPFMLAGGTVVGRGRGEELERLPSEPELSFVLGISNEPLSTAEVYARWAPSGDAGLDLDTFRDLLAGGDPAAIAGAIRNDLETAALHLRPELADRMSEVEAAGALRAFLSGSGPTIVGIARDEDDARRIAARLTDTFDRVEVVRSHPRAVELGR